MLENLIQIGEPWSTAGSSSHPSSPAATRSRRIAETSESGSVPELVVENPLAERVLLYDGEELLGAKQNRILDVSVLVAAKSRRSRRSATARV